MLAAARRLSNWLDRAEEGFMALSLAFMTLITFLQVVLRTFGTGIVWSLEATTYSFAWLVIIGMSYGVRTRAHIAVDLLTSKLQGRAARIVAVLALLVSLAYCASMVFGSAVFIDRLMTLGNEARDIPVPRWLLAAIMPLGFALLGLRLVESAWAAWQAQHRAGP